MFLFKSTHLAIVTGLTKEFERQLLDEKRRSHLACERLEKAENQVAAMRRVHRIALAHAYALARDENVSRRSQQMASRTIAALAGVIPEDPKLPVPSPAQVQLIVTGGQP